MTIRLNVGLPAEPDEDPFEQYLVHVDGVAAHIGVAGVLRIEDATAMAKRIRKLAASTTTRRIVLNLALIEGEQLAVNLLVDALEQVAPSVELIAMLWIGGGPSLRLAAECQRVLCQPQTKIGCIGHFAKDQVGLEVDRAILSANCEQRQRLAKWRPVIPLKFWYYLEDEATYGEQAEALGLVDGLVTGKVPLAHKFILSEVGR